MGEPVGATVRGAVGEGSDAVCIGAVSEGRDAPGAVAGDSDVAGVDTRGGTCAEDPAPPREAMDDGVKIADGGVIVGDSAVGGAAVPAGAIGPAEAEAGVLGSGVPEAAVPRTAGMAEAGRGFGATAAADAFGFVGAEGASVWITSVSPTNPSNSAMMP